MVIIINVYEFYYIHTSVKNNNNRTEKLNKKYNTYHL